MKSQGLNAEKSRLAFCALFTKAIQSPQFQLSLPLPAAPARRTFHQGCRAGIRLPTAEPPEYRPPLFR